MITLSWEDVMEAILKTTNLGNLFGSLQGHKVYGIPRGGTIVAALLSYRGCELTTTPPERPCDIQTTVIVDDIADTGKTLSEWAEEGFPTIALFIRAGCNPLPTWYAHQIEGSDYVAFPWESPISAAALEAQGVYKDHVTSQVTDGG